MAGPAGVLDSAAQLKERVSPNPLFRKGILLATHNRVVASGVKKYGMRLGASRFVAGEALDEAVGHLRALNQLGLTCNTTILGEAVKDEATVNRVVADYQTVLDRIASEGLSCNVALKLTHLGLDLDEEIAYRNVEKLIVHAAGHGNFIRMDMEESGRVDATLRIYKRLRAAGHDNCGTVLQSYLYRTDQDLADLLTLRPNLRIVKGAYLESPDLVYPQKADVDRAYVRQAERMLNEAGFAAIATHDKRIIDHVIGYTERRGIPRDRFQFQLLYGISTQLQKDLATQGYSVLIATPHGPDWYYYLMRRLAERPANLLFFAKNTIRR